MMYRFLQCNLEIVNLVCNKWFFQMVFIDFEIFIYLHKRKI